MSDDFITLRERPEKLPPHDIQAEEAVVASIMVDPDLMDEIGGILRQEDFFIERNGWVYGACLVLYDKKAPINQVTVAHTLARMGKLDDIGGLSYLSRLTTELPTPVGAQHYAKIVREDADLRRLLQVSGQIGALAYQGGDFQAAMAQAQLLLESVRSGVDLDLGKDASQIIDENYESYMRWAEEPWAIRGLPTGFPRLDAVIDGLEKGKLYILAGQTSRGKSLFAATIATKVALAGHRVAILSTEMTDKAYMDRIVFARAGLDRASYKKQKRSLTPREMPIYNDAVGWASELPMRVFFKDTRLIKTVCSHVHLLVRRGYEFVVVDHLDGIKTGERTQGPVADMDIITKSLQEVSVVDNVPIMALSQLSKSAWGSKPDMSAVRGAGGKVHDADVLMILHVNIDKETGDKLPNVSLIVEKNKDGPTGELPFVVDWPIQRVTEQ